MADRVPLPVPDTLLEQITHDRTTAYWSSRTGDLDSAEVWLSSLRDHNESALPPRPEPATDDGYPTRPEGWESVVMAVNADTGAPEVVAGWTDAGVFVQYASTEAIVRVCVEAITAAYETQPAAPTIQEPTDG